MNSVVSPRHSRRLSFASVLLFVASLSLNAADQPAAEKSALAAPAASAKDDAATAEPAKEEVLTLDPFVVSSSIAPRRQLDSAASITTIDIETMKATVPIGLPELLKQIPGIFVASAGGEARANVYARGLPQTGGYVFVGLQQDGLPDLSEMNHRNIQPDLLMRSTSFIQRIENVRGGTAGIFQNNVPGGIINLISREPAQTRTGEVSVQVTDYNQIKSELWTSGPVSEQLGYALGISYRQDDGIRPVDYTANKGYVLQGNARYNFKNGRGFVRIDAKWLDDRSIFYLAIPMQDARSPHAIPGFDVRLGTQNSADIGGIVIPNTPLGNLAVDLRDGAHPKLGTLGATLELRVRDGLKIQNRMRYTDLDYRSTTLLTSGVATPIQTFVNTLGAANTQFATAKDSAGNYVYRLSYPGQGGAAIATPTALNGNGLAMNLSISQTQTKLRNFQNDFRVIQNLPGDGTVALGLYTAKLDVPKARNFFYTIITDVKNNPSRLDVEFVNATTGASLGNATYQGVRQASVLGSYRYLVTNQDDVAPFINYEQPLGNWTLDAGARFERKHDEITSEVAAGANLNQSGQNIPALRNAGFGTGTYKQADYKQSATTWTVGANYRFSQRFSAYGRIMSGYRMPIADDLVTSLIAGSTTNPINKIHQAETGVKYATRKFSVFATLIGSELKDQLFSGLVAQSDGSLVTRNVLRDTTTYGLEIDLFYTPVKSTTLHLTATQQRARFASDALVTDPTGSSPAININGNRVINIPDRYFNLGVTYRFPEMKLGKLVGDAMWAYVGDTAIDEANRSIVPAYSIFDSSLALTRGRITYRLSVKNILNNDALFNGDARSSQVFSDPTAAYLNARPILPRSFVGSVTYSF